MKNRGFSRFPKRSWELWVSIWTTPTSSEQAYLGPATSCAGTALAEARRHLVLDLHRARGDARGHRELHDDLLPQACLRSVAAHSDMFYDTS